MTWDEQAENLEMARFAVWSVPPDDYDETTRSCLQILGLYMPSDARRVLDVGVGIGRLAIPLARNHEVVGIDPSPRMLALAREEAAKERVDVELVRNDATEVPPVGPVDFAYSIVTFQHLEPHVWGQLVTGVARELRPGGFFVFQLIDDSEFSDWGHVSEELVTSAVQDAGLDVVEMRHGMLFPDWLWVHCRKPE